MAQPGTAIRVLVVDDQRLLREGMRTLLSLEGDMLVVGEAADGAEALALARSLSPDVVLMDVRMPSMNGVEATRLMPEAAPLAKVLILTTFDDDDLVMEALREGAKGFLTKDLPAEDIAEAIRRVHAGGAAMPPGIADKVVAGLGRMGREAQTVVAVAAPTKGEPEQVAPDLTEREREVLRLLGSGLSNREIGEALFITEGTAKNHVSSVIDKLGLRDRTQAALWAMRSGLVE